MTDGPEPNGYELQRSIDKVDKSLITGLSDIKVILATLVSRDLFEAEQRRRDEQLAGQNQRIEDLELSLKDHQTNHSNRTWQFWAAIVVPSLSLAGTVLINVLR